MAESEPVRAEALPPLPPDLRLGASELGPIEDARHALGRLAGAVAALPPGDPVLGHLAWAEAVASSRLAGSALGLRDLLAHEGGAPAAVAAADVRAVARHAAALGHGVDALRGGAPLGLRLLREVHEVLLLRRDGRGRRAAGWGVDGSRGMEGPPGRRECKRHARRADHTDDQ